MLVAGGSQARLPKQDSMAPVPARELDRASVPYPTILPSLSTRRTFP
jgi:hypothetical protein